MSKSTVVSLIPFPIEETKPGLYPGRYCIPAAKDNDFEILVVEDAHHFVYLDMDRGSLKVPTPSFEVARSICEDYIGAKIGYVAGEAIPGIFFIDGEYKDKKAVLAAAKEKIDAARVLQRQWFIRLVEIADDEWNKYHSHKSISDTQRFAATSLGLEREWNVEGKADANAFCPACKSIISLGAIICGSCRTVVDVKAYKELGFVSAGA